MAAYPECLETLIVELCRLPGIGRKSAERLAFHLIGRPEQEVEFLAKSISAARGGIRHCRVCHGISEDELCRICSDPGRSDELLCVIERARDIFALERGSVFSGRYHVLGGVISPLSGIGPDELNIDELLSRIRGGAVKEVILALNPSTEGETTSIYLARLIHPLDIKVTRIAYGLPVGGELEFSDPVTLARALEGRRDI